MNDPAPPPVANPLFKWLITGLPLGLIVMSLLSIPFYLEKRRQRDAPHPSKFAAMLRKDLNDQEFQNYKRIFNQEIGERSLAQLGNLEASASYIESSMGIDNMGYEIVRREFEGAKDQTFVHIEAELSGKSKPRQLVLVAARYDGTNGQAPAALLCLAHAFTGKPLPKTIRFVAFSLLPKSDPSSEAFRYYREIIDSRAFDSVNLVALGAPADVAVLEAGLKERVDGADSVVITENASLTDLKNAEGLVLKLAGGGE